MEALFINTKRTGYAPNQCGFTLSVAELIAILEEFDGDTPIYLKHDGGYTYGAITEGNFEVGDTEEEG